MNPTEQNWHLTPLSADLSITCHSAPALLDTAVEQGIEAVWQQTLQKHPRLYNGRVFCLSELRESSLSGFWCEYRWVLAQMRSPELATRLNLRSLAVTALLICPEGIVLGRRHPDSLYLPGFWQGVPAGSVESRLGNEGVDLKTQLLTELEEEIGLTGEVSVTGPFWLANTIQPGSLISVLPSTRTRVLLP
ncbi:NUDIX hydrolase [Asaia prunellae]|uniref:hypothetical protein n=1 Tax=Asaia prunellae TaxID=610245 RepID=UPI0006875EBB|nr:hypothetical protein [Asaia prunellae]